MRSPSFWMNSEVRSQGSSTSAIGRWSSKRANSSKPSPST